MSTELKPCSHCRAAEPLVQKKSGRVGYSKTPFYRETISCKSCKVTVSAGTPGNAVTFWNRSYDGRAALSDNPKGDGNAS